MKFDFYTPHKYVIISQLTLVFLQPTQLYLLLLKSKNTTKSIPTISGQRNYLPIKKLFRFSIKFTISVFTPHNEYFLLLRNEFYIE
jgi:hypothetical protein